MEMKSLGLIETIGMIAGVEAADTAVKAANVSLVGFELTKGSGMVTIKIRGDVGAVKAAVDAAKASAKEGSIFSSHVIPRPDQSVEMLVKNKNTAGCGGIKPEDVMYGAVGKKDSAEKASDVPGKMVEKTLEKEPVKLQSKDKIKKPEKGE